MAMCSSISATTFPPFTSCYSSISPKPQFYSFSLTPNSTSLKLKSLKPSFTTVVYAAAGAAAELLDSEDTLPETIPAEVEGLESSASLPLSIGADSDKMAPKQKIRIKLRSYWTPLIEDSCKQIMDAATLTNAKLMGPVYLPTKIRKFCVLKSPHVHKDARFHFEIRTHQRLIDILYPTAQTIDSLMQLDLPAGVDVEVKL